MGMGGVKFPSPVPAGPVVAFRVSRPGRAQRESQGPLTRGDRMWLRAGLDWLPRPNPGVWTRRPTPSFGPRGEVDGGEARDWGGDGPAGTLPCPTGVPGPKPHSFTWQRRGQGAAMEGSPVVPLQHPHWLNEARGAHLCPVERRADAALLFSLPGELCPGSPLPGSEQGDPELQQPDRISGRGTAGSRRGALCFS